MMQVTQPYPTKDGRYVLPHFNLPHLQARVLKLLDCELIPASIAPAVAKWDAMDLENAIDEIRVPVAAWCVPMMNGWQHLTARC